MLGDARSAFKLSEDETTEAEVITAIGGDEYLLEDDERRTCCLASLGGVVDRSILRTAGDGDRGFLYRRNGVLGTDVLLDPTRSRRAL